MSPLSICQGVEQLGNVLNLFKMRICLFNWRFSVLISRVARHLFTVFFIIPYAFVFYIVAVWNIHSILPFLWELVVCCLAHGRLFCSSPVYIHYSHEIYYFPCIYGDFLWFFCVCFVSNLLSAMLFNWSELCLTWDYLEMHVCLHQF